MVKNELWSVQNVPKSTLNFRRRGAILLVIRHAPNYVSWERLSPVRFIGLRASAAVCIPGIVFDAFETSLELCFNVFEPLN